MAHNQHTSSIPKATDFWVSWRRKSSFLEMSSVLSGSLPLDEDCFMVQPYKRNKNLENCPKKLKRELLKKNTTHTHAYTCFYKGNKIRHAAASFLWLATKKQREKHRWGTSHASWLEGTSSESSCTCILSIFLRRKAGESGTRPFPGGLKGGDF